MWTGLYLCFASIPWTTSSKQVEARNHRVDMCNCQDQEHPHCHLSTPLLMKFEAAKRHSFLTLFWCARMPKISSPRSLRTNLGAITSTCSLPLILSENLSSFSSCPWSSRQRASYTRPSKRQCCTSEIPRWLSSASDVLSRGACINIKSKQNEKTNCIVWL